MKNLKPITILKLRVIAAEMSVAELQNTVQIKDTEIKKLNERLTEARRRTLCFGYPGSSDEINFLPICVTEFKTDAEMASFNSDRFTISQSVHSKRFILTVLADMIDPPVVSRKC